MQLIGGNRFHLNFAVKTLVPRWVTDHKLTNVAVLMVFVSALSNRASRWTWAQSAESGSRQMSPRSVAYRRVDALWWASGGGDHPTLWMLIVSRAVVFHRAMAVVRGHRYSQ